MDWNYLFTSFDGRISRQPFWIGVVVLAVANLIAQGAIRILFGGGLIGGLLILITAVIVIYGAFAVMIKRCHDRGKVGWWSLIALIPVIGPIWAIIDLGILEGTPGPNEFGPDPLAGTRPDPA